MKKAVLTALCLLLVLCLCACGAAEMSGGGSPDGYNRAESDSGMLTDKENMSDGTVIPENQKLIQKYWINAETEDMSPLLEQVGQKISQLGGYIEAQQIHNGSQYSGRRYRSAELTIRIPADKLNSFVDQISEVSNIVSSNKSVDDVTLKYVATESRMLALQTEQNRLIELLALAENLEEILIIEDRLTDVRTELEQVTSTLKLYDNQVSYGTVYLSIDEVREYTVVEEPKTVWERIGTGFVESLKNVGNFLVELFVFLVVRIPYLVLIAAIVTVIIVLLRLRKKKKKRTPPVPPQA